jgi:hypothetical protein
MTINRRTTLEWLASVSVLAALPRAAWSAGAIVASGPVSANNAAGYGTDPNLTEPVVPWPLIMAPHQLQQTAVLSDLILPGSPIAPAPSTRGVADFINEWVSAPYPDQLQDRTTLFEGLRWIDAECLRRAQRAFLDSDTRLRQALIDDIAVSNPTGPFAQQQLFFRRLRFLVVTAYYTTPEGFQEMGYSGNVPLAAYPPVTDDERAILHAALEKLGLSL